MSSLTRDTHTDTPGTLVPLDMLAPAAVDLPALDGFDPTRVRLTGLRAAEWSTEAACAGKASRESDPWHPNTDADDDLGLEPAYSVHARTACVGCPVRTQCLALGLALLPLGDVAGMYAGYAPAELRRIARARGMADRTVAQHGTRARRVAGCDCAPCKRAHAEYVAELRAQERYAESDAFDAQVAAVVPLAEPTETPVPDLFALLREVS